MMKRSILKSATTGAALMLATTALAAYAAPDHSMSPAPTTNQAQMMNWYGGPAYTGKPALAATAALVRAGGGADHFDFSQALVAMLGKKAVNAEVAKLNKQYGKKEVQRFLHGVTFDVRDGLKRATEAGVKLPAAPANLKGAKLAKTLVMAGTAPDGTFYTGYLFDHALSHKLHVQVMQDVNMQLEPGSNLVTHKILNQAMYDVAHALGNDSVKLASLN
jgi:hypothetical protein